MQIDICEHNEPGDLERSWRALISDRIGPNCWTHTYLADFAQATGFTLVTFDRGFSKYRNTPVKIPGL
jgi:hypothetical protein